jgi:hypothetical protein
MYVCMYVPTPQKSRAPPGKEKSKDAAFGGRLGPGWRRPVPGTAAGGSGHRGLVRRGWGRLPGPHLGGPKCEGDGLARAPRPVAAGRHPGGPPACMAGNSGGGARRGPGAGVVVPGPGAERGLSARRGASSTLLALGRPRSRQSPLHGPRPLAGPPPGGWRETPQEGSCWPLASRGGEGALWAVGRRGGPRWPGPGGPRPTWKHLQSPGGRSLARAARPGRGDTPPRGPPRGRPGRPPAGARAPLPGRP